MSSLKPNNDILTYTPTQGSQAPQQTSIINNSNLWANIPEELKERPQWVVSGASKAPLYLKNEEVIGAKSTDPATWMSFNDACKLACDNRDLITTHTDKHGIKTTQQGYSIGYMLSAKDPFTCIDLDVKDATNCTDASQWTTPDQYDRYWSMVQAFNSYTETSRSGKGLHIWVRGNIGVGCRRDHVEVYSQERYIICTGHRLEAKPIVEAQALLENMVSQMRGTGASERFNLVELEEDEPDEVVIDRAMSAGNGQKFNELCMGRWQQFGFPSQSEADLALMSMFCFYSESNEQCKRLFRMSKLGKREKAIKDNKYLNSTLELIRTRQEKEKKDTDAFIQQFNKPKLSFFLTSADLKKLSPPTWLIKNVIPETGFGIIYGKSGTYKSFLTIDLLAHIANGRAWFGNNTKQKPVIYIPLEGKSGISKRIEAWKIHNHSNDQIISIFENINFKDKNNIEYLIEKIKDAGLDGGVICIDTLAQAGGDMDENSSKDMGNMIKTFQYIQQELGGIVLVVHHTGKDESKGMRGHSSLYASLDFALECTAHGNLSAQFKIAKSKDSESDKGYTFKMSVINLGYDEDGELITSLAVNPEPIIDIPTSKTKVKNIDRVLMAIQDYPEYTQTYLTEYLSMDKGNVSKDIKELRAKGYIDATKLLVTPLGKNHLETLK
ncbi:TPA: AAA family ATPase [Acinetobacter baumannii]|nr:AAA family ATPase [Acinetobacter baumannii]